MKVKVAVSKKGNLYRCLVVYYRDKQKCIFVPDMVLMDMLNVSPEKYYSLAQGEYEIK